MVQLYCPSVDLTSAARLYVLLCRIQFSAKDLSHPVGHRECGFAQITSDELCDHAETPAMRRIVVHNQLICVFEHLREVRRCLTIRVNHAGNGHGLATTTHTDEDPPNIQLRIFGGNKQNRRRVPSRFRLVQQLRVDTNVPDSKRAQLIKKWPLQVSQWRNKRWKCLFQVGFIET